MTSATNTNKTTHKFGTVLRTIACILCITTIPNVGWANGCDNDNVNECLYGFSEAGRGTRGIECDSSGGGESCSGYNFVPKGNDCIIRPGEDQDSTNRLAFGRYQVGHEGSVLANKLVRCVNGGLLGNFDYWAPSGEASWCPDTDVYLTHIEGYEYYPPRNSTMLVVYIKDGKQTESTEEGLYRITGDFDNYKTKTGETKRVYLPCYRIVCDQGFEPSSDKKSCVARQCDSVCTSGGHVAPDGTEQCEKVCDELTTADQNAEICEHKCVSGTSWDKAKIISCKPGFYPVDGECKPAGCKDGNVEYDVGQTKRADCNPEQKYAKKCEQKCLAGTNETDKHWSDTYIAECIDGATFVMDTEKSNTIKMCFLDKPYNDAIAKLNELLNDIIHKCGNDGEHIPQESESPGPEPHVPLPLT